MSDWRKPADEPAFGAPPWPATDAAAEAAFAPELNIADDLLDKADALLRRHRADLLAAPPTPAEDGSDDDDLPILTEIVSDFGDGLPVLTDSIDTLAPPAPAFVPPAAEQAPATATPATAAAPATTPGVLLAEQLIELDTEIAREIETWLAAELPQIVARELDSLGERIRVETLAHLRATLLPELSARIARRLDPPAD